MLRTIPLLLLLTACSGEEVALSDGILGEGPLMPYPNGLLVSDDSIQIPADAVPISIAPDSGTPLTPFPVERMAFRSGFSPGQSSVVVLDDVDPSALPNWRNPTPGEGGVRLYDLASGTALPVMAELDAWCDTDGLDTPECDGVTPSLIVRPLIALTPGERYAVVVTTDAAPRPEHYDLVVDRRTRGEVADHQRALQDELAAIGVDTDSIAVAWDFPVSDGSMSLRSALSQVEAPNDTDFEITLVRSADELDALPPGIWKLIEGKLTGTGFLVDDEVLDVAADGSVSPTSPVEMYVHITIPETAKDAPGDAPILLFGHGLFGEPQGYLGDDEDEQQVSAIAVELGAITVATTMRGVTADDRLEALEVAADFGKFPLVTDRVVQGQANTRSLLEASANGLFEHEGLRGATGQVLTDGSEVMYYGISLGGIEGQVLLAQGFPIEAAVLHVPGGMWSTMLERSTQWSPFEIVIGFAVPSPNERQLLYALTQVLWDPVDPVSYTADLAGETYLLQESIGDEQVANLTTRVMARSAGASVLEPAVDVPWEIPAVSAPHMATGPVLAQFDPMVGIPDDVNRPASNTRAHSIPRTWPGARQQTVHFLSAETRGEVIHPCGTTSCTEANPGD